MDFSDSFARVRDSVIQVLQLDASGRIVKSGSGVIFGDGDYAITCEHCIEDGTTTGVRFANTASDRATTATVVATDAKFDLALLRLPRRGVAAPLRHSSTVKIGHFAFVVGYPLGITAATALSAHIAGVDNHLGPMLLRIDSSVNDGNSGGPLFNEQGEVVGVVNAKHGELSDFLAAMEQHSTGGASMSIGGFDPVEVLQKTITAMRDNLNLGIGYAIPIEAACTFASEIKAYIQGP
jgi:serine protease Do